MIAAGTVDEVEQSQGSRIAPFLRSELKRLRPQVTDEEMFDPGSYPHGNRCHPYRKAARSRYPARSPCRGDGRFGLRARDDVGARDAPSRHSRRRQLASVCQNMCVGSMPKVLPAQT